MHNLLSSSLISKNVNIDIYSIIIRTVVLYGGETWPLTLRKECTLRMFENRKLRKIFVCRTDKIRGSGGNYIMKSFMICTHRHILFG